MRCTSINLLVLALAVSSDLGANARPTDYVVLPNGELMNKRDPDSTSTLTGIASGACAYIGSQVSAACKDTHPHIALAGQVVQHAGTAVAAGAALKGWYDQRTGEKEEEKKKITEEKGKAKAEEPKKETKEQGTQTEAEKGTQTEGHKDLTHHDAHGAPQQHLPQEPLQPVASGSGTKHEEKPETKSEEKPQPPVPAAHKESTPAPPVKKPTLPVESHEMKPIVHKAKTG